ncbi:hypothetical protein [Thalassorhabdomicrobium marinisediminis]|uniref:hypothetical protein n=1 Tax=Thalassorhabdomicrobium marinisediminis TaxID=2170577 RepID=UPI002490DC87|nr:hypothetical protein [Thalassorhabdomicrobium marinisediminis]
MTHSPAPARATAFAHVLTALDLALQAQAPLFYLTPPDAPPVLSDESLLIWMLAEQQASRFAQSHAGQSADHLTDLRAQMVHLIFTVLDWDTCTVDTMLEVFRAACRVAYDVPDGTLCRSQMMEALILLDTLLEIQAHRFGVPPAKPLH